MMIFSIPRNKYNDYVKIIFRATLFKYAKLFLGVTSFYNP